MPLISGTGDMNPKDLTIGVQDYANEGLIEDQDDVQSDNNDDDQGGGYVEHGLEATE